MDELKTREAIQDEREARGLGGHRDRREGRANVWCNKPATSCLAMVLSFLFFSVSHSPSPSLFFASRRLLLLSWLALLGAIPDQSSLNNRHVRWVDNIRCPSFVSVWREQALKSQLWVGLCNMYVTAYVSKYVNYGT